LLNIYIFTFYSLVLLAGYKIVLTGLSQFNMVTEQYLPHEPLKIFKSFIIIFENISIVEPGH